MMRTIPQLLNSVLRFIQIRVGHCLCVAATISSLKL